MSSSSVSGSESDPGFYTYDDGREADDEQSDWYPENGPTWGIAGVGKPWWENEGSSRQFRFRMGAEDDCDDDSELDDCVAGGDDKKFQQLLKSSWHQMTDDAKEAYRLRMQKLRDRIVSLDLLNDKHVDQQEKSLFVFLFTSLAERLGLVDAILVPSEGRPSAS